MAYPFGRRIDIARLNRIVFITLTHFIEVGMLRECGNSPNPYSPLPSCFAQGRGAELMWATTSASPWFWWSIALLLTVILYWEKLPWFSGVKLGLIGNIGFFVEFPGKIRLCFGRRWPPIWLPKAVSLRGEFRAEPITATATLSVRPAPLSGSKPNARRNKNFIQWVLSLLVWVYQPKCSLTNNLDRIDWPLSP